jgi:hypothetical protein
MHRVGLKGRRSMQALDCECGRHLEAATCRVVAR